MSHDSTSRRVLAGALLLWLVAPAAAQQRPLSLDDLYDPEKRINFDGEPPRGLVWLDPTHYIWPRPRPGVGTEWLKVDAATGRTEPFFDADKMEAAVRQLPGVTREQAARLARQSSYTMNGGRTATVLTINQDLCYYEFGTARATRLTATPEPEEEVSFSPDDRLVAFVREHDLHVVDVATARERRLTTDGSAAILNGKLDWVYQEEIYGRGTYRGYWWSPDSTHLAFLQLDERPVPEFTVVDHIPYRLEVEQWDYPKAGDPNPFVQLGTVNVGGGGVKWIDTAKYAPSDLLIVNVSWSPDSHAVVFQVQNREQTWLDLNLADLGAGGSRTILRETTKAWVNENGDPTWLKDGSFLWFSERSGWKHLYHYAPDDTLLRQITAGEWDVRRLLGVDESAGWIYFEATERSPIGIDVYRARLDGGGFTRLSQIEGTHSANFNPPFSYYIDTWSDVMTPSQVRLHRADGSEVRVIDANKVAVLANYRWGRPEFLQVMTRDEFPMEAMIIRPPDVDPSRKYPVYELVYGGPGTPQVRNAWGGTGFLYLQLLAQRGIIVWICDNRTASGKGAVSAWPVYQNFGELELRDIEDGVAWLKQQPYVDPARIGVSGWSYGGYLVSYALTHSRSFAMGIAGGSVTDWRDYDTIYTERYMRMPQNNPEGYRKSSPRFAAKDLSGRLLLVHGTIDDNVHLQNTLQFAYELQQAGKTFELMLYPKSRHAVTEPRLVHHLRRVMLDFTIRTLEPDGTAATPTASR